MVEERRNAMDFMELKFRVPVKLLAEGQYDGKNLSNAKKEIVLTVTMRDWVGWVPHSANSNAGLFIQEFTATNPQDEENQWTLAEAPRLIHEGPYGNLSSRLKDQLKVYLEHDGDFPGRYSEPSRDVSPTRRMDKNAVRVYSVNFHGMMAELIEVRRGGREVGGLFATGLAGTSRLIAKVEDGVAYVIRREPFDLP